MTAPDLEGTARSLVAKGKGILAADESFPTIKKRFESIGLESTQEHRGAYREMLFTAPGIEEALSGVILFDETIRDQAKDGTPLPEVLSGRGIIPGIKADTGAVPLAGFPGEKITQGLDGLHQRLAEWRELGARFTKWRAVITIGDGIPTGTCLQANAEVLARFAALSQEAGLVPIVEPEALMKGSHRIERCYEVTTRMLQVLFDRLFQHRVKLEGTLLKTNMVTSGQDAPEQAGVEEVAQMSVRCLRQVVPPGLPGIVFLSGGQSEELATAHLDAMNRLGDHPWELSFSYGRALQASALKAWNGQEANVAAGQAALQQRARLNGAARYGRYTQEMERG